MVDTQTTRTDSEREARRIYMREYMRRRKAADPDYGRAQKREYYLANKQSAIDRAREWKRQNRDAVKESHRRYRSANKTKIEAYAAAHKDETAVRLKRLYARTKEVIKARSKAYYHANIDVEKEKRRAYKARKKEELSKKNYEYHKRRLKSDPVYRFKQLSSRRMCHALKGVSEKSARTMELLGCNGAVARAHIERQFVAGMTWENHGEWHVDHIKPLASFDLTRADEQRKAFHYTNLQPLWAKDNRAKWAKVM